MARFMIVSGATDDLRTAHIEKVFESESLERAKEIAAEYLTDDGLPTADPGLVFRLFEITEIEGFNYDVDQLWKAHKARLALGLE